MRNRNSYRKCTSPLLLFTHSHTQQNDKMTNAHVPFAHIYTKHTLSLSLSFSVAIVHMYTAWKTDESLYPSVEIEDRKIELIWMNERVKARKRDVNEQMNERWKKAEDRERPEREREEERQKRNACERTIPTNKYRETKRRTFSVCVAERTARRKRVRH